MAMADEVSGARSKPAAAQKKQKKSFTEMFIPLKTDSTNTVIAKCITLLALLAVIVCGIVLICYFAEMIESKNLQSEISYIYNQNSSAEVTQPVVTEPVQPDSPDEPEVRVPKPVMVNAQELLNINPDTIGYVRIPNTHIDGVVVQRKTEDGNDYYLNHNFKDKKAQCGTIFLDMRCTLTDYEQSDNLILYGHNQADGTMFGEMDYYRWDLSYYKKNPLIYFNSNYEEGVYKIISSFVVNVEPEHDNGNVFDYHNYINFNDEYTYDTFIDEITKRSTIITGTDVNENDKFLTLSTCSTEWEPSRHVIVARKVRPGESTEVDLSLFSINPNPKWPAIYYKYNGGTYIEEE